MKPITCTTLVALSLLASCGQRNIHATLDGGGGGNDGLPQRDGLRADVQRPGRDSGIRPGCAISADCLSSGHYCHLDSGCVASGAKMGDCRPRPAACPDSYAPVCGCDGKTYSNSCDAHAAGINVKSSGACGASCAAINSAYFAEVAKAKSCCATCAALQCNTLGKSELGCPCPTFLNTLPSAKMKQLEADWLAKQCNIGWACDAALCPSLQSAYCDGGFAGAPGTCMDLQAP